MNRQMEKDFGVGGRMGEPEATLRLIARLPAPDGLEDRVKSGLHRTPTRQSADLLGWPLSDRGGNWMRSDWMRGAAAAAIVAVVGGGCWQVYSRVQPKQAQMAIPHVVGSGGGFSSANAMRTPKTLDAPMVTQSATPEKNSIKKRAEKKKAPEGLHRDALQPVAH